MSDVHLAKIAAIQRSVTRAREELTAAREHFVTDLTRQDAALLNVLRACESALDLANVLIRERQLGIPQSSRDSFRLLLEAHVIPADVALKLQKMVGFRNVAIHRYQELDLAIMRSVIENDLDNLLTFSEIVAQATP